MQKKLAVGIDWNGTLSTSKFWEHVAEEKYTLIQEALFGGPLTPSLSQWLAGTLSAEDVVGHIATHTNLDYREILSDLKYSCEKMQLVSDKVLPLVKLLRTKGIIVAITTDNMDTFTRWTLPAMQISSHFDEVLNSFDLKARKRDLNPDGSSNFFRQFFSKYGIHPENLILIDDTEDKDGILGTTGIDYRKIEAGSGLVPELKRLVGEI